MCKVRTHHVTSRDQRHDNCSLFVFKSQDFELKSSTNAPLPTHLLNVCVLTCPSLCGFQLVSPFLCAADHWLTSPQLPDHSDQCGPRLDRAIVCNCRECPAGTLHSLFHLLTCHLASWQLPTLTCHPYPRATSKSPSRSMPHHMPRAPMPWVLQWGHSQPHPAGSTLAVPSAMEGAGPMAGSVTIVVMTMTDHNNDRPRRLMTDHDDQRPTTVPDH